MQSIRWLRRWSAVALLGCLQACAAWPTPTSGDRTVHFPGSDVELTGVLFEPRTAARPGERRPAIVLLHGCSGMRGPRGQLPRARRELAEQLAASGFVALHVDSFGSRGIDSVCDLKERPQNSHPWSARTRDAYAALDFLVARPDVDRGHVFVLGWSHGGSTVTGVVRPEAIGRRDGGPRFRAAIAFYPGCDRPLRTRGYRATMPLLILHGQDDDWTPAAPCIALAEQTRGTPFPVRTIVYPGARHGFDSVDTPVRLLPNVYNPQSPTGRGAYVGTHEPSRLAANREVRKFLAEQSVN